MNYEQAMEFIHQTLKFGIVCGLDNITQLLSLLGNPQNKLRFVHVAGTNGKGSTCSFINEILIKASIKTGLYTSPYLENFNERIRINNKEIENCDLARIASNVKDKCLEMVSMGYTHPTEFEIVTAMGFLYFEENDCDIVILEVGLGGRLDATNVISESLVSVITSISFDHMNVLGNSIEQISYEKAGIIKPDSTVILYPQSDEITHIIKDIATKNNATIVNVDSSQVRFDHFTGNSQIFSYKNFENLKISLLGKHQILNASTAIDTALALRQKGYHITDSDIRTGLANAIWAGRFEIISNDPLFIIDGAHNVDGALALSDTLINCYPNHRRFIILGLLKDKDVDSIINIISQISHTIITVKPLNDRALDANSLSSKIKLINPSIDVYPMQDIQSAIQFSLELYNLQKESIAESTSLICSCGSLYYIGEVRKVIMARLPK